MRRAKSWKGKEAVILYMINVVFEQRDDGVLGASRGATWRRSSLERGGSKAKTLGPE